MSDLEASPHIDIETQYEDKHVHQVYNSIASHFSSTRFKPWPVVDAFLRDIPTGSIGLDIGCGNGKYLTVRRDVFIVGSDRSSELLKFAAQHQPHDVAIADTLSLPHPNSAFDFAISIAVVHHLSTQDRRREAVKCILSTLKPAAAGTRAGEALIFVWALEQKTSRRGWDTGDEQDVLVPWVLKGDENISARESKTFQRYYHLYRQGELEDDVKAVGGIVIRRGYDRDNWWVICARRETTDTKISEEVVANVNGS